MKRACTLLLLSAVLSASAGMAKFDAFSRMTLHRMAAQARSADVVGAFVALHDGAALEDLEACGLDVSRVTGDIAIVRGAPAALMEASALDAVRSVRVERSLVLCNDLLVRDIAADKVHVAPGVDGRTYTGAGVVTGLFDTGFDFRNPTYRADGHTRIQRVWHYTDGETSVDEYADPRLIDALDTDDADEQHGSHVLGTMAGRHPAAPYNGVATGSDIAVACGELTEANIADGVSRIAAYARTEGKPCVINLSIADCSGPCDGTDEFCRSLYASTAGSGDAVLVMSAGNDNGFQRSISKTFGTDDTALRSFILPDLHLRRSSGVVAVWSGDGRPLKLTLVVMEMFEGTVLTSFEVPADEENAYRLVTADCEAGEDDHIVTAVDAGMSEAFGNSYVTTYYSANSATNGRPNYYIEYDLSLVRASNPSGSKELGIIVEGAEGQRVDMRLIDSWARLYSAGREGWTSGRDGMTISSMGCTEGAVCVGSHNTRRDWTALNGNYTDLGDGYAPGAISPWSSYGVTVGGKALPHVTAPGAAVVSVKSTPYLAGHDNADEIVYECHSDGRTDYWGIGYGTSMSSPAVAGGIALWLEADPSLSAADIHEVIAVTSRREPSMEADAVAWGAGKFDAEAGLREVLARRASLSGPSAVSPGLLSWRLDGTSLEVVCAGVPHVEAVLYDLAGRMVASASACGDTVCMDIEGVVPGVYVLRAAGESVRIALR